MSALPRRKPMTPRSSPMRRGGRPARRYRPLSTRAGVKDALDKLTSLIVRKRDGMCLTCGATESLECSHYFKRRFLPTRWSLRNCHAQCSVCNQLHNTNPFPYRKVMVERYGEESLDSLFALRNSVWRPSTEELRELLDQYKKMLKEMQ